MHLLRVLLLLPLSAAALSPQYRLPAALVRRDDTCPADDYEACGSDLPGNFCCPKDSTCLVLAGNTTALCCPSNDCPRIATIPCDLSIQDVSKNPKAEILTTALNGELPTCGEDTCCPYGYSCNKCDVNGKKVDCCLKDDDQDEKPASATKKSTSTAATSTKAPTSSPTGAATPAETTPGNSDKDEDEDGNEEERAKQGISVALIGGIFGTLLGLALLSFGVVWWFRRRGVPDSLSTKIYAYFRGDKFYDGHDGPAENYYPQQRNVDMSQIPPGNPGFNEKASNPSTPAGAGGAAYAPRGQGNRNTNGTYPSQDGYDGKSEDDTDDDNDYDEDDNGYGYGQAQTAHAVRYERPESVGVHNANRGTSYVSNRSHGSQRSQRSLASNASLANSRYGPGPSPTTRRGSAAWGSEWARTGASGLRPPEVVVTAPEPAAPLYSNPPSNPSSLFGNYQFGGPTMGGSANNGAGWPMQQQQQQQPSPPSPPSQPGGSRQFIPYRKGSLAGSLHGS